MDILGRVKVLLSDADPERLGVNLQPDDPFGTLKPSPATGTGALGWHSRHLLSPMIRHWYVTSARRLGVAVSNSLVATGWMLRAMLGYTPIDSQGAMETAKADHAEAVHRAARLETLIRES
jgi:hypothetical protein